MASGEGHLLSEISSLTKKLGDLDDDLLKQINAKELLLAKHNPNTRVVFGKFGEGEIRWGKYNGHWRFLWTDGATATIVPLSSAPRHVRAEFSPLLKGDQLLQIVIDSLKVEIKLRGG